MLAFAKQRDLLNDQNTDNERSEYRYERSDYR